MLTWEWLVSVSAEIKVAFFWLLADGRLSPFPGSQNYSHTHFIFLFLRQTKIALFIYLLNGKRNKIQDFIVVELLGESPQYICCKFNFVQYFYQCFRKTISWLFCSILSKLPPATLLENCLENPSVRRVLDWAVL